MANIFSIFGQVFIDNEKANKSIEDTTKKGKDSSKSFSENFSNVSKSALKIGSTVIGTTTAIVSGLTAMANKTADNADTFDKASLRSGIFVEDLQALNYAAGQSGVSLEAIEKSAKKLNERTAEVSEGNKKSAEMFKNLGVSVKDSNGNMKETTELYYETMLKLADLGDTAEATAIGTDLFGKAFVDMKPLLAEGSEGINDLQQKAYDLGIVMGEDAINAGVVFGDTMSDIKQSLGGAFNKVMSALIPVIQKVLDLIIQNMPTIQSMIDQFAPILINLLEIILPIFTDFASMLFPLLFDLLKELLPPLSEIIEELMPIFTQILKIILPPLIEIIKTLLPILMPIIKALLPLIKPLLDALNWGITNVLMPIVKVISSIADAISKILVKALNGLKPVIEGVKNIFEKVFGGLFNIVKVPINAIISGINVFIKALNKIKIPEWVPKVGGKGINLSLIKKLKVGMEYVPYDEMPALLHKGEAVLTKEENEEYRKADKNKSVSNNKVFNNTINIEHLEIREEKDIKRIAEELYYLQQSREV